MTDFTWISNTLKTKKQKQKQNKKQTNKQTKQTNKRKAPTPKLQNLAWSNQLYQN